MPTSLVKKFNIRLQNKIDSSTNFANFVPLKGELLIGTLGNTNSLGSPYIAKVGDGTTTYSNLPTLGEFPLIGSNFSSTDQIISSMKLTLNLDFEPNVRKYVVQEINNNNDIDEVQISIPTTANPMYTEHYVLLKNKGNSDVYFSGLVCASLNGTSNPPISTRCDYIRAGEFCEISIKIFKVENSVNIIAIPNFSTGQEFTYTSGSGTGTWYVNVGDVTKI